MKRVLDPKTHMDYNLIEIKKEVLDREPLKFRISDLITNIAELMDLD